MLITANMLTVKEGEESPLQPLFTALDAHVKGEGDNAGQAILSDGSRMNPG